MIAIKIIKIYRIFFLETINEQIHHVYSLARERGKQ
jgi:hypothetical protein